MPRRNSRPFAVSKSASSATFGDAQYDAGHLRHHWSEPACVRGHGAIRSFVDRATEWRLDSLGRECRMAQPNDPILLANAGLELRTCRIDSSSLEHVVLVEPGRTSRTDFRPMDLFSYLHILRIGGQPRKCQSAPDAPWRGSFG